MWSISLGLVQLEAAWLYPVQFAQREVPLNVAYWPGEHGELLPEEEDVDGGPEGGDDEDEGDDGDGETSSRSRSRLRLSEWRRSTGELAVRNSMSFASHSEIFVCSMSRDVKYERGKEGRSSMCRTLRDFAPHFRFSTAAVIARRSKSGLRRIE